MNLIKLQRNELTEHLVYKKLSLITKDKATKKILEHISKDELKHYTFFKKYTKEDIKPDYYKLKKYVLISRLFGIKFGLKLMEKGEANAQKVYSKLKNKLPITEIIKDEHGHEKKLINIIDEEKLKYMGSIVLGLNDALVELTGALAGFTLTLQKTNIIAIAGLITGIAASLSMAASEYLSKKTENKSNAVKASIYTGFAYILTVLFLIFPYFIFNNAFVSLMMTVINAILVILLFTFYVSVTNDFSFKRRFIEMAAVSLGIAVLTFCIGLVLKTFNIGI